MENKHYEMKSVTALSLLFTNEVSDGAESTLY